MKRITRNILFILTSKERREFFASTLFGLTVSLIDIGSLALLFLTVQFYTAAIGSSSVLFLNFFSLEKGSILPAIVLLLIFAGKSICGYRLYKYQYKFAGRVVSRISSELLEKYLLGSYHSYISIDSAVHTRKIFHNPVEFGNHILSGCQQIITESCLILFTVIALSVYDISLLAGIAFLIMPVFILVTYFSRQRLSGIKKNIKNVDEKMVQYLNESLAGYVESNIFHKSKTFTSRYRKEVTMLNSYIADIQIIQVMSSRFFEMFAVFGFCLLIIWSLGFSQQQVMVNILKLGTFIAAAYKIVPGVSRIANLWNILKAYDYITEELKVSNTFINYPENNYKSCAINSIQFKDVQFLYGGTTIFSKLNFTAETGTITGIKGDSGTGKTTLVNLIVGFMQIDSGDIFFNGKATTDSERRLYQQRVAYVKQQPFLLHESLLNNIILFENDYSLEKLAEAMKATGLDKLIKTFPEGVNHVIAESGRNISGGQRQRIAIARALYKEADLIILDEPFNELDDDAMCKIMTCLKTIVNKGKMILLISHNQKCLSFCDKIIEVNG